MKTGDIGAPTGTPVKKSDLRLNGDGLIHQGVEVVLRHGGENGVDGIGQLGVALLDGDTDVHVLGQLLLGSKLEVTVGAGEVQDHQIVVLGNGGQSGRHIGADIVHSASLELHDHSGRAVGGSQQVGVFNLGQAGIIPDGAGLRGAGAAGQIGNRGGVGIGAVLGGQHHDGGVVVRAGHVNFLHPLGGHGLTGNVGVHGAGLHGGAEESHAEDTISSVQPLASAIFWAIITS